MSPHIARIVIDRRGIRTTNASRALFAGPVTLESLDPMPKNPIIANFFTQMGRSEELGSGTRNLYRYSRLYTGRDPVLEDGDRFTAFVPALQVMGSGPAEDQATPAGEKTRQSRTRISSGTTTIPIEPTGGTGCLTGITRRAYHPLC